MNWLKRNRVLSGAAVLAAIGLVAFWVRSLGGVSVSETAPVSPQPKETQKDFYQRYGLTSNAPERTADATAEPVQQIRVTFRAVMLDRTAPGTSISDADFAFEMEKELKKSPLFDSQETTLAPAIIRDETAGTFSFGAKLKLKQPLKL